MSVTSDDEETKKRLKERVFGCLCVQAFLSVAAHTMNLQSESILIRNACGNDLGTAARISSMSNAAAGVLGLVLNQVGGKLSDSLGRRPFYLLGPISQIMAGLACFLKPRSLLILVTFRTLRAMATTFSGTVISGAAMRDMFVGAELGIKSARVGSVVGLAIMVGPLLEGMILSRFRRRGETLSYLALACLGLAAAFNPVPETLSVAKRKDVDLALVVRSANPFGFTRLYTHGSLALRKLVTIVSLQGMIDGKTMSDLSQIWMREHLKLGMETIRNFTMCYGCASTVAGLTLTPYLLKNLSVVSFTAFTNLTNLLAFNLRGASANPWLFFGCLPLMLPGVNSASSAALGPVLTEHMVASGFGVGESQAWASNLRVFFGAAATVFYGYFYSWCRKRSLNAGLTYVVAGLLGAGLPQLIMWLTVRKAELQFRAAGQERKNS